MAGLQAVAKAENMIVPPNLPKDAALLQIKAKCVYEDDKLLDHVKSAMKRPIPHFVPSPQHDHEARDG